MEQDVFVVAIDGPSGSGKSTVGKLTAERMGFAYLDSGALYRAVALGVLDAGIDPGDAAAVARVAVTFNISVGGDPAGVRLDGREVESLIRSAEVSKAASKVSAVPEVRAMLTRIQREAAKPPGAVVEGRDIGTVIFPDAGLKVFLNADPTERVRRRSAELPGAGAEVQRDMAERDRRDSTRPLAPLETAADALVVDSTRMSIEEVVELVVGEVKNRQGTR